MPRVRVSLPDELLQRVATRAQELGKHIDELYVEAIDRYVEVNKSASAGSLRSRSGMPRASPQLNIEIPEELFQRGGAWRPKGTCLNASPGRGARVALADPPRPTATGEVELRCRTSSSRSVRPLS